MEVLRPVDLVDLRRNDGTVMRVLGADGMREALESDVGIDFLHVQVDEVHAEESVEIKILAVGVERTTLRASLCGNETYRVGKKSQEWTCDRTAN